MLFDIGHHFSKNQGVIDSTVEISVGFKEKFSMTM